MNDKKQTKSLANPNGKRQKGTRNKTGIGESEQLYNGIVEVLNKDPDILAYEQAEWEAPVTFDKYPVPDFPVNIFNEPIRSMVEHVAESIQTPIDLPAVVGLGILSTCIQKKFEISPKLGWREPLNLYSVSLLPPSTRKSAVFSIMKKPIEQYEEELMEEMELVVQNRQSERDALKKRIETLQREFAKDENPEYLENIKEINKRLQEIPKLYSPRLVVDDATPEALVSKMHENEGKISILTSEGDLFERFKNKNIDQIKYDVYLKPYSGDSLRTDRQTRDTQMIEKPIMTICVTAQPSVVKKLPSPVHDRGLIARFFLSVPNDNLGHRDSRSPEVPAEVIQSYTSLIRKLLSWETDETISLELSDDALNLLHDTMDEIEIEFRENGAFHDDLKSWGGKLIGQLLRIAGLLHVSNQATMVDNITEVDTQISKETLATAIKLKDYLIAHAEKAFGVMKKNQAYEDAEYLLKLILRQNRPVIKKQVIHQNAKKKVEGPERMQRAYNILEYHSYIQQAFGGKSGRQGLIWVNPEVLEDTETTKKDHNSPNQGKTVAITEETKGEKETLESPNTPSTFEINSKKQKEGKQESPTTPASQDNTENNKLIKTNYTPFKDEYKVVKV